MSKLGGAIVAVVICLTVAPSDGQGVCNQGEFPLTQSVTCTIFFGGFCIPATLPGRVVSVGATTSLGAPGGSCSISTALVPTFSLAPVSVVCQADVTLCFDVTAALQAANIGNGDDDSFEALGFDSR